MNKQPKDYDENDDTWDWVNDPFEFSWAYMLVFAGSLAGIVGLIAWWLK